MTASSTPADMIVEALTAAMAGDPEPLKSCLHDELVVHEPPYLPYGGDYKGAAGFLDLFAEATKVIDTATVQILSAVGDRDRVVLLMSTRCHGSDEETFITEHWVLRDNKIIDVRVFWYSLPFAAEPALRS